MPRLADLLWAAPKRAPLISDFATLIESHVAARRGLKGIALKASFATLKSLRPGAVPRALEVLLPKFAEALDPLYQESRVRKTEFSRFLQNHADRAAAALLSVTDARVALSHNAALKSIYARLRRGAESEVLAVLPALADLLQSRIE